MSTPDASSPVPPPHVPSGSQPPPRRPISEKKLAANRANAKKSTGPRSAAGKRRSSMNRLLHGMRARTVVLPSEDPRTFNAFAAAIRADLRPNGPLETMLAKSVIEAAWRLCRAGAAEGDVVANVLANYGHEAPRVTAGKLVADAVSGDPRATPYLDLDEYAAQAQRALFAALRRLHAERRDRSAPRRPRQRIEPTAAPVDDEAEREVNDMVASLYAKFGIRIGAGEEAEPRRSNPPGTREVPP